MTYAYFSLESAVKYGFAQLGTNPARKTKKGFLEFMDELLSELPEEEEYLVILENHSIRKRHSL